MKTEPSLRSWHRNQRRDDILFSAPQFVLYAAFTLLPFLVAVPFMFTDYLNFTVNEVHFIGLKNFVSVFQDPVASDFLPALRRTFVFTILNFFMVFLLGLPLALLMFEFNSRWRGPFFTIIFLPYMMSGLGVGLLLNLMFSKDTGTVNLLLMKLNLISIPVDIKDATTTVLMIPLLVGWRFAGFNMAIFLAGLLSIPSDTVEASIVDGVNYWQRLRYVYLPQIVPSITIATILCLIGSFGVFDEPAGLGALYGNQSARFLSIILFSYGFGGNTPQAGSLAQAVVISMIVYLPLLVIALLLNRLQKRLQYQ